MKEFGLELLEDHGFHLTGFPDAAKVIALHGPLAQELADMALHEADLQDAEAWLRLSEDSERDPAVRAALWKIAIVTFAKCFGSNHARTKRLRIEEVLPGDSPGQEAFRYFKSLRDKNIAHDDNPFSQCLVGAVINPAGSPRKAEQVVTLVFDGLVHEAGNVSNLANLISASIAYVRLRRDALHAELLSELEAQAHEALLAGEDLTYRVPLADDVHDTRSKLTAAGTSKP